MDRGIVFIVLIILSFYAYSSEKLVICNYNGQDWQCIDGDKNEFYSYCLEVNENTRVCSYKPIKIAKV